MPAVTPVNSTFTAYPTISPAPTFTPPPPAAQPTTAPVEGMTSTQVNVRADPSTAGNILGVIPANTKVQISGRDPAGNWWQILFPQGKDGRGWVTSQYVSARDADAVPVIGNGTGPDTGSVAVVLQQINVRSGAGTGFNSLGTLNARDVVRLTGRDANGAWLQVQFSAGPEGKGWVNAAFVQAKGVESLPIITEAGEAIGTGTPTGIPPTPTATVVPAWDDQDSQEQPVASVVFEPLGIQTFIYNGDISSPEGDSQDWIRFTPYTDTVYASLDCRGSPNLQVSILENGQPSPLALACGDAFKPVSVRAGTTYLVYLQVTQFSGGLQYAPYTVTIRTRE
ncbi:MAG: SH3 domain-containing protein [Bacteroidota bacterium]